MIRLIIISITFQLLGGFMIQSVAQTLSKQQVVQITNQVDSVFQEMLILAEKLEYDKLSSGVDDTREAGFISNRKYYPHYASMIDELKPSAQGVSHQDISINQKKITVLSDKIVLMTTSGISNAYLNDGREITVNFHWSFVYEKIDNNWKVIHSHQSTTR